MSNQDAPVLHITRRDGLIWTVSWCGDRVVRWKTVTPQAGPAELCEVCAREAEAAGLQVRGRNVAITEGEQR